MNKHILKIKELVADLNCMGTYGLVELELTELEKLIDEKNKTLHLHSIKSCKKMCPNVKCTVDDCPFVYDDDVTCPL